LIESLGIDGDLVEIAAQTSEWHAAGPSAKELSEWVRRLPEKDNNELLIIAALDPGEGSRSDLMRRFYRQHRQHSLQTAATGRAQCRRYLGVHPA
jgi:hypothetical protein